MNKITIAAVALLAGICSTSVSHAQAFDAAYGFPFGYTLGAQWGMRNRLPAPPYFSMYPPVYYGKRYVRPYGESPYASFPLLGQIPDYAPVPAETQAPIPRTVLNPHAPCCSANEHDGEEMADEPKVNVVAENRRGSMKIIVNPYAQEQMAKNE